MSATGATQAKPKAEPRAKPDPGLNPRPDGKPNAKSEPKPEAEPRRRGWLWAGLGLLAAGGLAGYGIWSRSSATTNLTKSTDDSTVPRVQMIIPKNGPAQRTLALPGNIEAWYQAAIYGQVGSGSV